MIQSSHRAYGSGRITSIGFTETSEAVKQITLSVPTETMDNLSETYQNTLPEIQVNPCRAHQKTKQIHAGTLRFHQIHADSIRFPPKSIHNQSESQQNHAESIRTSTKIHQNLQIAQNSCQIQAAGARVNWLIQPLSSSLHPGKPTDPLPQKGRATSRQIGFQPQQAQESMQNKNPENNPISKSFPPETNPNN